ncbi:MAG: hypothetical protein AB7S36_15460 [Planctomycetota bacterium]
MKRYPMQMLVALLAVACIAGPLYADPTPAKGEPGRDWGSAQWCGTSGPMFMGQLQYSLLPGMQGEVVVIVQFNASDAAQMKALGELQALYAEHAGLGLWVLCFEKGNARKDNLEAQVAEAGLTISISAGGGERYRGDSIPAAWIIGVEGKVEYTGGLDGLAKLAEKELKKIKYPGLRIPEVHKDAEKAAKAFASGDYVKARDEAKKVIDNEKAPMDAQNHCRAVEARVNEILGQHTGNARNLERAGNIEGAIAEWEWIADKFGRADEGKDAKNQIKRLKSAPDPAELAAQKEEAEAQKMLAEIEKKMKSDPDYNPRPDVDELLKKYPNTTTAKELAKRMPPSSGGPTSAPDEKTCGGASPEEVAERVIEAWKKHNTDDLQWCSQPGDIRTAVQNPNQKAESDFLISCITVRSYKLTKVYEKDNDAYVEYEWSVRFDENKFYERMIANAPPNIPAAQAQQVARERAKAMKDSIEKSPHIMRLKKDGERWYATNDPFNDQAPQWRPRSPKRR